MILRLHLAGEQLAAVANARHRLLERAIEAAGLGVEEIIAEVQGEGEALDAEIAANQDALEKAGHWGVPTLVFDGEPFFGQDRIDMAKWRMEQKGLAKR